MKRLHIAVFAFLLPLAAQAKLAKSADPASAVFHAVGPAGLKIDGRTADVAVGEDGANVVVTVQLGGLDSGVSLRNKHMREKYLEVGKFPTAKLTVARAALQFPAAGARGQGSAAGILMLHGQSKPVTFKYDVTNAGGTYRVTGTVPVNLGNFGIEEPSFLGASVKPDVSVEVSFAATDL
jgi:polyisoprenoid-binding protein YceI